MRLSFSSQERMARLKKSCDGIKKDTESGKIAARYSCHICLIELYGRKPDTEVVYPIWDEDDEKHYVYNTLEVYLVDTGRI